MIISFVLAGFLVIAGSLVVVVEDDRALLIGLAVHTVVLALLALASAGAVMTGAFFVGNATALAVLWLGCLYANDSDQDSMLSETGRPRRRRRRRRLPQIRRGYNAFLQGLAAVLALVVALGLANKPIVGLSEAAIGLPNFVAYWLLAAGLVIIVLNHEYLKVGAGLLLLLNGGQILYLMSAHNLEARIIAASVLVVLALALGISYLTAQAAELKTPAEPEPPDDAPYALDHTEMGATPASEEELC